MKVDDFKRLKVIIENKLEWSEDDIFQIEQRLGSFFQEIQGILFQQRIEYENLCTKKDHLYGNLYKKYKYKDDYSWDTKGEIESQIKSDRSYVDLCVERNKQGAIIEYLEGTLKNISSIQFQIRDFIAYKKFKAGQF